MTQEFKAFRGRIFDFDRDAGMNDLEKHYRYFPDGLLILKDGKVLACGDFEKLHAVFPGLDDVTDYSQCYIFPGFIDAHVHSVQTGAIASDGSQLLEWLANYVFPGEKQFENDQYAYEHTAFFINQLLKNGTTTAAVFGSVHPASADAVFEISAQNNMRMICGNTWMDTNAPDYLLRSAGRSYDESVKLIGKWHGKQRLHFAVTPRFAVTSSPEGLEAAHALVEAYPGIYIQTHIAENKAEVHEAGRLHPSSRNYLDIYDRYGLVNNRTLLGHGIYLSEEEMERIAQTGASVVHCPTSNLFLGSGLFDQTKMLHHGIKTAVGSDVGAGTSFSMLQNLNEAYKISSLRGTPLNPLQLFYFITLGGAKVLNLDDRIGNFDPGKEADFVVIDPSENDLLNYRIARADSIEDILFSTVILGDDRIVRSVYVMGKKLIGKD